MRRIPPLSFPLAVLMACLLAPPTVAQQSGQQSAENWHSVATRIGGSGTERSGRYVRLIPSRAWHPAPTPSAWLAFRREGDKRLVRGSIPVLRDGSAHVVEVLTKHLPKGCKIAVRDSQGVKSPHVHVRFLVSGSGEELAGTLREVMEQIEPGALARIDAAGVIVTRSFDCEDLLLVRLDNGVTVDVGKLPAAMASVGTRVRLVATRYWSKRHGFRLMGCAGYWTTCAKTERLAVIPALPPAKPARDRTRWLQTCRKHGRALIHAGRLQESRVSTPLATGFDTMQGPDFPVCPGCHHALEKHLLLSDASHEQVGALLACCAREHLFYLGRDGFDHGPFRPLAPAKEIR